ncbi:MAG: leucine-rich repeat domain-containing protein [Cytophagales bacterium]|nr:leucine-rich repeat domain-containing protein [Cytophagales bacterium]
MTPSEIIEHLESSLKGTAKAIHLNNRGFKTFPQEIFNYPEIKELYLEGNEIEEIPADIVKLPNLEILSLQKNEITTISEEIENLKNLKELNLYFNELTSLPNIFHHFSNLEKLNLAYNALTELPKSIEHCNSLMSVDISYNPIKELPSHERLVKLRNLNLEYTEIQNITHDLLYCAGSFDVQISQPILFLNKYLLKQNGDFKLIKQGHRNEVMSKVPEEDKLFYHQIFCNMTQHFDQIDKRFFVHALGLKNEIIFTNALDYLYQFTSQEEKIVFEEGEQFSILGNTILGQEQYLDRAQGQGLEHIEQAGENLPRYLLIGKEIDGKALWEKMEDLSNHVLLTERKFNLALEQREEKFFYAEAKEEEIENIRMLLYATEENVELALGMLPALGVPKTFLTDLLLVKMYQEDELQKQIDELIYLYASDTLLAKIQHFQLTNDKIEPKVFVRNLGYWTNDTEIDGEKVKSFRKNKGRR